MLRGDIVVILPKKAEQSSFFFQWFHLYSPVMIASIDDRLFSTILPHLSVIFLSPFHDS